AQVGVERQARLAIDPEGLVHPRDHEDEADGGVLEDVLPRVEPVVARPVGDGERPAVQDPDETRTIALGRDVRVAGSVLRPDQQEGGLADEAAGVSIDRAKDFFRRDIVRGFERTPELFTGADVIHVSSLGNWRQSIGKQGGRGAPGYRGSGTKIAMALLTRWQSRCLSTVPPPSVGKRSAMP